jgi:2-polyprenyl-6-hydroxyphenyl methylase/3-demethylubiquinone-9 3-methyltransferase
MNSELHRGETLQQFESEISRGGRYTFGKNWAQFLELLDEGRILAAERSLTGMLDLGDLSGKTFLDVGSGSGLFSLAARRLGARVTSFDFDPESVSCTQSLKARFYPKDDGWRVLHGSALDQDFMKSLSQHDIVYSWGVLHHTGSMLDAIELTQRACRSEGLLLLALYRKTWLCPLWRVEKKFYVRSSPRMQSALRAAYNATIGLAHRAAHPGRAPRRGMDRDRDVHDWLGGYPYESITPRDLKAFVSRHGFTLVKQTIKSEGIHISHGCDEFLFRRDR